MLVTSVGSAGPAGREFASGLRSLPCRVTNRVVAIAKEYDHVAGDHKEGTRMARSRRGFLKGAAAGAAVAVVAPQPRAKAQESAPRNATAQANATTVAADTGRRPATVASRIVEKPGSDFMVDVLKTLGFEYLAANPGSTFEGLHESLINYGDNKMPEFLTCCHEESAVAMAHGYAKIEGKPMIAMMHGTIGMQHASMA